MKGVDVNGYSLPPTIKVSISVVPSDPTVLRSKLASRDQGFGDKKGDVVSPSSSVRIFDNPTQGLWFDPSLESAS